MKRKDLAIMSVGADKSGKSFAEEPSILQILMEKLVTKEDYLHHHKILGVSVLFSFIYRYSQVGETDMGFRTHPEFTIPTVALHLLLSLSSFQFKIPKQRIKHGGRVWPEMRLHSLVFTCRSLAAITLYWIEDTRQLEPNYDLSFLICITTNALADLCSYSQGKYRSNSVRGVATWSTVKFFFSIMQFNATAGFLVGVRKFTIPFIAIFVIQFTPFLGTLQRKNLIGYLGLAVYGGMLVGNFVVQNHVYNNEGKHTSYAVRIVAFAAALMRLAPLPVIFKQLQSKYVVWTMIYLAVRQIRPRLEEIPIEYLQRTLQFLVCALLLCGFFKRDYYKTDESKSPVFTERKRIS